MSDIVLPPKRFQDPSDVVYDPIRNRKWFGPLSKRRAQLHLLKCALRDYDDPLMGDHTQQEICAHWGVDEREFRDYRDFVDAIHYSMRREAWDKLDSHYQAVLDLAYQGYNSHIASRSIRHFIEDHAALYGLNPRHVIERWEIDPNFWPTGYKLHEATR